MVAAVRNRTAAELAAGGGGVPKEVLLARLSARLHTNLGFTEDLARWSVETWAVALGKHSSGTNAMVLIPGGTFTMGNSIGDADITDAVPVVANVSAFYMDANLVTWRQWQEVYAYATNRGYGFMSAGAGKGLNHPVQNVNWYDCVKWCNARSEQAGKTPVY